MTLPLIANRYEVVKTLMGGMGVVHLCNDRQSDRPFVLKTFKPEYLSDLAARGRFLREGDIWLKLGRHPHIVQAAGVTHIEDSSQVYLVLELIAKAEGYQDASLRSWLQMRKPLQVETALLFALQIARGMKHATTKVPGLVHRDLKPENVLVGADRLEGSVCHRVRVTDFGLAAFLQDVSSTPVGRMVSGAEDTLTRTQLTRGWVGTPLYMAPEQWTGERLDGRADIYAFGCILYEMVVGERAVMGKSLSELERAHQVGKVRELPPELSAEVVTLIRRCMAVERKKRYESWGEVEDVLAHVYITVTGRTPPTLSAIAEQSRTERVAMGWSYNAIGSSYLEISKLDVAIGYFERVIKIGQAEKERTLEASGLGNLGGAYKGLGDGRQALKFYEQSLQIVRKIGDRQGEGDALGNLGLAYLALGDAQRAMEFFKQSLSIMHEINDRAGEGSMLNGLGNAHVALGEMWQAIEFFEQGLPIMREIGDRRREGMMLNGLGNAYSALGDVRQAKEFFEQVLAIAREIGNRQGEGAALCNLGIAYEALDEMQQAIEFYEHSLKIMRDIGDRAGEGTVLNSLGHAYRYLGNARRALKYHEQSLQIAHEIGDRWREGRSLGNLGTVYQDLGDMQQAMKLYEQHLQIAHQIGDRAGEGLALGNLGIVYGALGDVPGAVESCKKALQIAREIGDTMGAAETSYNLAGLLAGHQVSEALRHAEFAAQVWAQAGHLQDAQAAQQLIVKLRRQKG